MNNDTNFDDATGSIVQFAPAVRKGSHVLIGLYGFSGCGKTLCAVYLARGLVGEQGKVAMIDTETGRGLIYAMEAGGYDYAELTPPFTPERYTEAVKAAEAAGADCLILDSSSHEWEGIGGVLDMAEATGQKGLVKWANPKARHKKFVQTILNSRMHIILCTRAKDKMTQVTQANHRKYPNTRVGDIITEGMVAIQEKRFIYEMTVQVFLPIPEDQSSQRGIPILEKCPKDLLGAFPPGEQISIETGKRIAAWVAGGAQVDPSLQNLKRTAEASAEQGTEHMRAWWAGLTNAQQNTLKPDLPNLRSIAGTADNEIALKAREAAVEEEVDAAGEDRLADPFGLPPADDAPEDAGRDEAEDAPVSPDYAKYTPEDWKAWSADSIQKIQGCQSIDALELLDRAFLGDASTANSNQHRNEYAGVTDAYEVRKEALSKEEVAA